MSRTPTERQYRRLICLGSGAAIVAGLDSEIGPLARHGWVTGERTDDGAYPWKWVRITPHGLRALADAVERYGLPEIGPREGRA